MAKSKAVYSRQGLRSKRSKALRAPVKRSIALAVRKAIKYSGESKYYYTTMGTTNFDWNGTLQCVSLVPQGTTDIGRIGDALTPMALVLKGQLVLNQAGRAFCMGRFIVFRWLQDTDDTVPSVGDIIDYVGTDQVTNSPYTHDKRDNFNILYDSGPRPLHSYGLSGYNPLMININKRLKLAGSEIKFVGAGTTGKNHIYVMFLTDVVTTNLPYFRMVAKLDYKD